MKSVISLKYFVSFDPSNIIKDRVKHSIIKPFDLLNTILLNKIKPCKTCSTNLKYCYKQALNKKLKLMGGDTKYFLKKLLGHDIFRSMVTWATYLMYAPLD